MEPQRTVEYAVRFAAALSAWWLLAALPVVVGVGAWIYRRQSRTVAPWHSWGLLLLRSVIVAVVVFLAFRPSLIRREVSTYIGRLLFLVDDSGSMGIRDPALPETEALTLAREALDRGAGRETPAADLRAAMVGLERTLLRFEQYGRGADRASDAFWRETDRVEAQVYERLETIAQRAEDLAKGAGNNVPLQTVAGRCKDLQAFLKPLFSGDQPPAADYVGKLRAALVELIDSLGAAQHAADRAALDAGDQALGQAVAAVRQASRLELAHTWLRRHRDKLSESVTGLSLWVQTLAQPQPTPFKDMGAETPAVSDRETDLTGFLLQLLEAENPFPLAGIVLISDGRNLGGTALDTVTRAAALRSVPIYAAGVGGAEEPPDIAVREVVQAPVAIVGTPLAVRARLKTVLPKPEKVDLALIHSGGTILTNETLEIDARQSVQRRLLMTPAAEGLQRYTLRAGSVPAEVAPQAGNAQDFTVRIRSDRIRVLFMDYKPRWQSRFVLNILNRLDFLDVNALIVLAQPKGQVQRGVGQGFWPENADTLALYDLVILGDLPAEPAVLSAAEWQQVADYVAAGGTLALLGTGRRDPLPPAVVKAVLPTEPRAGETPQLADTVVLQLTPAGRVHPVTRSLQGVAIIGERAADERRGNETVGLLQTADGYPLVSMRFCGKGKSLLVDTDRLWRRLNATALDAHAALVQGIVDWAIETRGATAAHPQPDLYRYTTREAVQVWTAAQGPTNAVVELRSGERVIEAPATPLFPGAAWAAAVFPPVPEGDWTVAVRGGGTAPEPLRVVTRSRELHDLARDEGWLRTLASNVGGAYATFTDAARLLNEIQPRSRIERQERTWRLWDSPWVLAALVVLLTLEWVWRKLAGLV